MKNQPRKIQSKKKALAPSKIELQERIQNMKERKKYAFFIFISNEMWLLIVIVVLVLCGIGLLKLSDTIIGILLGTTTITVCAYLTLVVKYLFNTKA